MQRSSTAALRQTESEVAPIWGRLMVLPLGIVACLGAINVALGLLGFGTSAPPQRISLVIADDCRLCSRGVKGLR